jgi:hypothetical protein
MDATLRKAARTGDVAEARAALDSGAEVDCKSDWVRRAAAGGGCG